MMLHPEFMQSTWLDFSLMDPHPNGDDPNGLHFDMVANMGSLDFSSSFTTIEDYSGISSAIPCFPMMFLDADLFFDNMSMLTCSDPAHVVSSPEGYALNLDELGQLSNDEIFNSEIDDVCGWIGENWDGVLFQNQSPVEEESMISSMKSVDESFGEMTTLQPRVIGAEQSIDADNVVQIHHLLNAYGEAVEVGSMELGEVILQRIREKVSPVGATMERLAHYLLQGTDNHTDYLKQESSKNHEMAYRAFYELCPYGQFAYFTANMAILEAVPEDAQMVHIIDFDLGEGVQWASLLEAMGQQRTVRLTSITRRDDQVEDSNLKFKATQRCLSDYARSQGLRLKVEEMDMEELLIEKKRMKKRGGGREWMAINCMVNLPHMQMERSRKHAWEFIGAAKELLNVSNSTSSINIKNRGIITFGCGGDGLEMRKGRDSGFGSFFDRSLQHCHALFESMEWHFPPHLSLARTAMECLFVGPYVSSVACFNRWEASHGLHMGAEMEGWRLSQENLMQAKEMVRGENLYEVRIDGKMENEMVLEWNGTPLVTVSIWR